MIFEDYGLGSISRSLNCEPDEERRARYVEKFVGYGTAYCTEQIKFAEMWLEALRIAHTICLQLDYERKLTDAALDSEYGPRTVKS